MRSEDTLVGRNHDLMQGLDDLMWDLKDLRQDLDDIANGILVSS